MHGAARTVIVLPFIFLGTQQVPAGALLPYPLMWCSLLPLVIIGTQGQLNFADGMQWTIFILCLIVIALNFAAMFVLGKGSVSWEVIYVMAFVGKCGMGFVGKCGMGFVGKCGMGFVGKCADTWDLRTSPLHPVILHPQVQ